MEEEDGSTDRNSNQIWKMPRVSTVPLCGHAYLCTCGSRFGIGDGPVAKVLANFFTDPADLASLTAASCLSGTNLRQAQRVVRSWDKQIAGKGAEL